MNCTSATAARRRPRTLKCSSYFSHGVEPSFRHGTIQPRQSGPGRFRSDSGDRSGQRTGADGEGQGRPCRQPRLPRGSALQVGRHAAGPRRDDPLLPRQSAPADRRSTGNSNDSSPDDQRTADHRYATVPGPTSGYAAPLPLPQAPDNRCRRPRQAVISSEYTPA